MSNPLSRHHISTAIAGVGSVQQGLSAAYEHLSCLLLRIAADKRYSFCVKLGAAPSTDMSSTDWISAIASAVSALGGAFAAVAAFRSARSAHETQQAASNIEFRARLREIAYTVVSIDAEITRVRSLARHLEKVYSDLAIFNRGFGESRHELVRQNVAQRLAKAIEISETAKPFLNGTEALVKAPAEDTDRVLKNLTSSLARLKAYASEFETELQSAETERTLHQQSVISGRPGA